MIMLEQHLSSELAEIAAAGLTRRRRILESPCGRIVTVDGKEVLNFASNDYLGLAGNSEISQALADGAKQWGAGSGASHLVSGHQSPHETLEREIAEFTGFPRALTFSTGYLANLAIAGQAEVIITGKIQQIFAVDRNDSPAGAFKDAAAAGEAGGGDFSEFSTQMLFKHDH